MRRRFMSLHEGALRIPFYIEALEDGVCYSTRFATEYKIDEGDWGALESETVSESINTGSRIYIKGVIKGDFNYACFSIVGRCKIGGNIQYLGFSNDAPYVKYVAPNQYTRLFGGCTTIEDAISLILPATTLATECYRCMFYGCTSLTTAPELPATTLANYCYSYMFYGCTSLTTAPELPATTLANYCYSYMFDGCTSLTTAPELPATSLAEVCYGNMFYGCKSLTTAPELPATTLAYSCYYCMFYGCNKLNYIKMLATDITANSCLYNWVRRVASSGTFVKNPAMTTLPTATSSNNYKGIPSGWTVVNDGEESGGGELITFYIMSKMISPIEYSEYTAVEGMTWGEWLSSEYNVNNYTSVSGIVFTPDEMLAIGIHSKGAKTTDVIIKGQKYDWI